MTWKNVSAELREYLETTLSSLNFDCQKKKLFGCPGYFVYDNMFTGVFGDTIFLRLIEKDRQNLLSEYEKQRHLNPYRIEK